MALMCWPYEKIDFVDIIIIVLYQIYTGQTCAHILYQIHFVFQVDYQPFSKTQYVKCFFYMVQAHIGIELTQR
jgi:hypothetical protein